MRERALCGGFGDTLGLVASTRALAHAPWSASKVHAALQCPRLFHYRYVDKIKEPETMPEARVGKAIHSVLERALQGAALASAAEQARKPLETELELARFDTVCAHIPPFIERIEGFRRRRRVNRQLVEFPIAIRKDITATSFNAGDAFFRGILDVGYVFDDDNLTVVDHKSGERSSRHTITEQLEGYAVLVSAYFRHARRVWLGIHWVASASMEWVGPVQISEVQQQFLPSLLNNIEAAALAVHDGPRPNPGAWCERCSYRSLCPTGRELRFEPVDDDEPEPWM